MIEESVPTFEAFCRHVDAASLAADQERARQYVSIVNHYASFAGEEQIIKTKSTQNVPLSLRWRTAGLRAICAIATSDALAVESSEQLNIIMPIVLENLSLEEDDILTALQQRGPFSEKTGEESFRRRRMSIATVTTVDTADGNSAAAVRTTADADKAAEDEIRVLAVRSLKQIFSVGTGSIRGQTRLAAAFTLRFIATKRAPQISKEIPNQGSWATSLLETIARWTPVQDRFIIVVTAMETLVRSAIIESALDKQLILVTMVDWLLSSDINLIGLSVMDVLLGLIQHTLSLLQLGGRDAKIMPHHQQTDTLGLYHEAKETFDLSTVLMEPDRGRQMVAAEIRPSPVRQELLYRLQKCIASLANHIYYTDQITDMMTALLARLKPSVQSDIRSTAAAINNPLGTTKAIAESASLQEDSSLDGFFSFVTARVTALKSVKDILLTANHRRTATGTAAEARSRVGVQVWEATQWLLKDEDQKVRIAYVDALLTWLKLETNKNDLLLPRDGSKKTKLKKAATEKEDIKLARRAVSNASRKEPRPAKSTFLQLLHLAIYDHALDQAEEAVDIVTLYSLLTTLVDRLGVNAIRTGLPMIMRLQESALAGTIVTSPQAKVNVATLVHAYLWSIAERFDFETSKCGQEISAEISRRKRFLLWQDGIKFPATSLDELQREPVLGQKLSQVSNDAVETLRPFLNASLFVDEIAAAYDRTLHTPPASPPTLPGRLFSVPTLGFGYGYGIVPNARPSPEDQLPQKVKDELLGSWSREACIAAVEKEGALSIAGSKTGGASFAHRNRLAVNGLPGNETASIKDLAAGSQNGALTFGLPGGLATLQTSRRVSTNGSPGPGNTNSSRESTMRVSELKRALSGYNSKARHQSPLRQPAASSRRSTRSSASESVLSWNPADDEEVPDPSLQAGMGNAEDTTAVPATVSSATKNQLVQNTTGAAQTVHDLTTLPQSMSDPRLGDDVPPVPKLPPSLDLPGTWPRDSSPNKAGTVSIATTRAAAQAVSPKSSRIASSSYAGSVVREGRTMKRAGSRPASRAGTTSVWSDKQSTVGKIDLGKLLAGISSEGGRGKESERENAGSVLSKPPY